MGMKENGPRFGDREGAGEAVRGAAGKAVRLRIELKDADLFSFRFR